MSLPISKRERKERPIFSGVLNYFPDALAEVANVSYIGNNQHNPGEPLHWSRGKSNDHADCLTRHLLEHGTIDVDGQRHTAKLAWRALALLQIELEGATQKPVYSHQNPPPGYGPCTRRDGHDGPCALPYSKDETGQIVEQLDYEYEEAVKLRNDLAVEAAKHGKYDHFHGRGQWGPVYLSGPMRGKPANNFPAFDEAKSLFEGLGYAVISPADMDRADPGPQDMAVYADRDYAAIRKCKYIAMLPGWEHSVGAVAEFYLARWLGLPPLDATTGVNLTTYIKLAIEEATMRYLTEGK